jgi:hypothetical protein
VAAIEDLTVVGCCRASMVCPSNRDGTEYVRPPTRIVLHRRTTLVNVV